MSDCCENPNKSGNDERHLVILGGGSAAFAAATKASELGGRVTIVNDGLPIGGTCVNVGCVPSKTLIRAAEAHHPRQPSRIRGDSIKHRSRGFRGRHRAEASTRRTAPTGKVPRRGC